MVDKLVARGLTLVIVGLIAVTAGAALTCGYHGLLDVLGGQLTPGSVRLGVCPAFGAAAALLIRYKDDLMDR